MTCVRATPVRSVIVVAATVNSSVFAGKVLAALIFLVVVRCARDVTFFVQKLILTSYGDDRKVGRKLVLAETLAAISLKQYVVRTVFIMK